MMSCLEMNFIRRFGYFLICSRIWVALLLRPEQTIMQFFDVHGGNVAKSNSSSFFLGGINKFQLFLKCTRLLTARKPNYVKILNLTNLNSKSMFWRSNSKNLKPRETWPLDSFPKPFKKTSNLKTSYQLLDANPKKKLKNPQSSHTKYNSCTSSTVSWTPKSSHWGQKMRNCYNNCAILPRISK